MKQIYRCPACMEAIQDTDAVCPHCGFVFNASNKNPNHLIPGTYLLHGCYLVGNTLCTSEVSVTYLGFDTQAQQVVMLTELMPNKLVVRMPSSPILHAKSAVASSEFIAIQIRYTCILQQAITLGRKNGVINIINVFQDNGTIYAVSEVSKESLYNGSYNQIEALRVSEMDFDDLNGINDIVKMLEDAFKAVEEYNSAGIFICGISPVTLVCTRFKHAELMLSEALAVSASSGSSAINSNSAFIARECYTSNEKVGAYSDVYSFAAVIYRLCFSENPNNLSDTGFSFPTNRSNSLTKWQKNALMNAMNLPVHSRTQSVTQLYEELCSNKLVMRINVVSAKAAKTSVSKKNAIIIATSICAILTILLTIALSNIMNRPIKSNVVVVPNFIGKSLDQVRAEALENDLVLQIVGKEYNDEVNKDCVCSQDTDVGQSVDRGSIIQITLSAGKKPIDPTKMPNIESFDIESAKQVLDELGIKYTTVEEYNNAVEHGLIISQSIEVDSNIEKDDIVILTVSLGPEPSVPTPTPTPAFTKKSKSTPAPTSKPPLKKSSTPKQDVDSDNAGNKGNDYISPMISESPASAPKESLTPSPKESLTPTPEESSTPTPKESLTPSPEESSTPTPKESLTPSLEESSTPSSEESSTPTPEESSTLAPQES